MNNRNDQASRRRRGTVVVLSALLMVPLLAMVAFAVDYGFLLKTRTDLQRAADAAALAAVQDLVPAPDGSQNLAAVRARIREYLAKNFDPSFVVLDSDIEIGRYDPASIYSSVTLLNSGVLDTVRLTVRRDAQANQPVSLYFARALGTDTADVSASATAVLQRARRILPGVKILPFAVPRTEWDAEAPGAMWSIYADGRLTDSSGDTVPGNWGTVDIGPVDNATVSLRDQIAVGLRQSDLDALNTDGRIPDSGHIEASEPLWTNGDPGMSIGMKDAVREAHGSTRIVPIFDTLGGDPSGGNVEFHVVGWGVVKVIDSHWQGEKHSHVHVEKAYTYDGALGAQPDLRSTADVVEGAFTSPVLVE